MSELDRKIKLIEMQVSIMQKTLEQTSSMNESLSESNKELKEDNKFLRNKIEELENRPAPKTQLTSLSGEIVTSDDPNDVVSPGELIVAAEREGITLRDVFPI